VVAVIAAATGFEAIREGHAAPTNEVLEQVTQKAPPTMTVREGEVVAALSKAFRTATHSALPGVVAIQVETRARTAQQQFRLPFGLTPDERQMPPSVGSGSGFVFRSDGYILTNNHVVDQADRVTVQFQDGREAEATVVGRDPATDIAVVKVELDGLETVNLGNSDVAEVGDWVVALGFPLNLTGSATVTAGIVSAIGRDIGILRQNTEMALEHFIQTDAAINPGNSGGPLVDLNGSVIGVNSAIMSPTGFYSGYGFAIPINIAKKVSEDLIRYGEVRRPQLGVAVQNVSDADKEALDLPDLRGAKITQITADKPAEKAGLELGDVIVAVDGEPISDAGRLTEMLATNYKPGDRISLDLIRYGKRLNKNVTLDMFEPVVSTARESTSPRTRGVAMLGFAAADITPQIARNYGLDTTEGVVVTAVDMAGSARGYLREGSIIEQVNGKSIESVDDLEEVANQVRQGGVVSLIVRLPPEFVRTIVNYRLRQ